MKTITLRCIALLFVLALAVAGPQVHGHEKKVGGPQGGRLLKAIDPHAEFFVTPERKVQITFLDAADKPVAPTGQSVVVTIGERAAPATLSFTRKGNSLLSDQVIPAGDDLPTVVQIKTSPDAKEVVERFHLGFAKCPDCKNPEYACTCGH